MTGARAVFVTHYDSRTRSSRVRTWSGLGSAILRRAIAFANQLMPEFDPIRMSFRDDANEAVRRLYREKRPVDGPLATIARNAIDDRVLQAASSIAGLRHTVLCPLIVNGESDGTICLLFSESIDDALRQTCATIANHAAMTIPIVREVEGLEGAVRDGGMPARLAKLRIERLGADIATLLQPVGSSQSAESNNREAGSRGTRIDFAAVLGRPLDEVFAAVTDFSRSPEWQAWVSEAHHTPPGPIGVGTVVTEKRHLLGRAIEIDYEITVYEPNRRICVAGTSGPLTYESCILFEGHGDGTVLRYEVEFTTGGFFSGAEPLVVRAIQRQLGTDLATLNDLLHVRAGSIETS